MFKINFFKKTFHQVKGTQRKKKTPRTLFLVKEEVFKHLHWAFVPPFYPNPQNLLYGPVVLCHAVSSISVSFSSPLFQTRASVQVLTRNRNHLNCGVIIINVYIYTQHYWIIWQWHHFLFTVWYMTKAIWWKCCKINWKVTLWLLLLLNYFWNKLF